MSAGLILGQAVDGVDVAIDLDRLVGAHLCLAAMPGAGKSRTLRRLLEATHGRLQHIVLDSEDEFYTLRESFDYVIAGGDNGDCPATVGNAEALALAILENGLSTIVQLNGLGLEGAQAFVGRFLRALIEAPPALWHPMLVVVDEAQRFAPQVGKVESSDPVINLVTQGRKRGFTAALATQRLSRLDKNATGGCTNWMLGRVGQSVDRRAVADALGFAPSSPEGRKLNQLENGRFWVQGPALTTAPTLVHVADVRTTHLKAGEGRVPTPPPAKKLRSILAALAALAKPAEIPAPSRTEELTDSNNRSQVASSRGGQPAALRFSSAEDLAAAEGRGFARGVAEGETAGWDRAMKLAQRRLSDLSGAVSRTMRELVNDEVSAREPPTELPAGPPARPNQPSAAPPRTPKPARAQSVSEAGATSTPSEPRLSASAARLLDTIERSAAPFLSWSEIAMLSVLSPNGGNFNAARKQLLDAGAVVQIDGITTVRQSPVGATPLDRGAILLAWCEKLGGSAARILTHLSLSSPATWGEVAAALGLSPTGGNWNAARKALRANSLVVADGTTVSLNPLFDTHTRRASKERRS